MKDLCARLNQVGGSFVLGDMIDAGAAEFCLGVRTRLVGALTLACGDRGVAEELAQETLARVWERWPHVSQMETTHQALASLRLAGLGVEPDVEVDAT